MKHSFIFLSLSSFSNKVSFLLKPYLCSRESSIVVCLIKQACIHCFIITYADLDVINSYFCRVEEKYIHLLIKTWQEKTILGTLIHGDHYVWITCYILTRFFTLHLIAMACNIGSAREIPSRVECPVCQTET